jgi:apolipoprotein N-acyltransferase
VLISNVTLALLSALLLVLAFPAFDFAFLAWVALVPLFVALRNRTPLRAGGLSVLTGSCFWLGVCYWTKTVPGFAWLDYLLCGLYVGAHFSLLGVVFSLLARYKQLPLFLFVPAAWVSVEYLRAHSGFLGVPWALLGHSQYQHLSLIQIASITGVYGVSFVIAVVNVAVYEALHAVQWIEGKSRFVILWTRLLPSSVAAGVMLVLSFAYGFRVLAQPLAGRSIDVTVIQGNIPQHLKWKPEFRKQNLEQQVRLTREAVRQGPTALIVWPESAASGTLPQDLFLLSFFSKVILDIQVPLLVGGDQHPRYGTREFRRENRLNSAFLLLPRGGISQSYSKMHLLPFGEYLPYRDVFPWPSRLTAVTGLTNFLPGTEYTLFTLGEARFAALICWESLFPEQVREFVNRGAEFLVNITNEAWFGETAAPYQFWMMNVFRAVENRVAVVRAANTGVSGFIDPYGRILGKVEEEGKDSFVAGYVTKPVPLSQASSFYTLYGDVWAYGNLAGTVLFLLGAGVGIKHERV